MQLTAPRGSVLYKRVLVQYCRTSWTGPISISCIWWIILRQWGSLFLVIYYWLYFVRQGLQKDQCFPSRFIDPSEYRLNPETQLLHYWLFLTNKNCKNTYNTVNTVVQTYNTNNSYCKYSETSLSAAPLVQWFLGNLRWCTNRGLYLSKFQAKRQ
jgi:hypothetical protein